MPTWLTQFDGWIVVDILTYLLAIAVFYTFILAVKMASKWRYDFDAFREEMHDSLKHLDPKNPPPIHLYYAENHYRGRKWDYLFLFGALPSLGLLVFALLLVMFHVLIHPSPIFTVLSLLFDAIALGWFGWIAYVRAQHATRYQQLTQRIELKHYTDNFEAKLKTGELFLIRVYWNVNEGANDVILVNAITAQLAKTCATRDTMFTLNEAQQFFNSISENPPPLTDVTLFVPEILDISRGGMSDEDHDVSIGTF